MRSAWAQRLWHWLQGMLVDRPRFMVCPWCLSAPLPVPGSAKIRLLRCPARDWGESQSQDGRKASVLRVAAAEGWLDGGATDTGTQQCAAVWLE
uniref:Uncharacterized protein n=1 Tax=Oryza rufipogon TaxID=4529 RepID=A0A0E0P570_ORYRU